MGRPYVARGSKTIDELSRIADRMGEDEICLLRSVDGRMDRIAVDAKGGWRWL